MKKISSITIIGMLLSNVAYCRNGRPDSVWDALASGIIGSLIFAGAVHLIRKFKNQDNK